MEKNKSVIVPVIIFTVIFCTIFLLYFKVINPTKSSEKLDMQSSQNLPSSQLGGQATAFPDEAMGTTQTDNQITQSPTLQTPATNEVNTQTQAPQVQNPVTDSNQAPGEFAFTSPTDNERIYSDKPLTFNWSKSSNTQFYMISLKDRTNNKWIFKAEKVGGEETSYRIDAGRISDGCDFMVYIDAYNGDKITKAKVGCHTDKQLSKDGKYTVKDKYLVVNSDKVNCITNDDNLEGAINRIRENAKTIQDYYNFTPQQKACLNYIGDSLSGHECYSDYKFTIKDLKKVVEFRFEGVGAYDGAETPTDSYNRDANPTSILPKGYDITGMFGAMSVVIKNGEIQGLFLRSSTLPNNYITNSDSYWAGCIKSGIYNILRTNHQSSFAALTLRNLDNSGELPAVYDARYSYSTAINIHHNYGKENCRSSLGCQVMPKANEWKDYIKLYDYFGNINNTWGSNESKYNKGITLRETVVGKYVLHRCINISVSHNGRKGSQKAKCHHVLTQ